MGLTSCYCLHDDYWFLQSSLRATKKVGSAVCFVSKRAWDGSEGDYQRVVEIAKAEGAEVVLGDWPDEALHRSTALAAMKERGHRHILIPDGDEIPDQRLLEALVRFTEADLADVVRVHMDTYWKDLAHVIRPREKLAPILLLNAQTSKHDHTLIQYAPLGTPVVTTVDAYDAGGRKTSHLANGLQVNYTSDPGGRLLGQSGVGVYATFVYDPLGNTLLKWHQGQFAMTMSYDPANRLTTMTQGAASTAYSFDPNGNQVLDNLAGVQTGYVYDKENRLKKVTHSDGTLSSYTYAGDGLRRTRQEPIDPAPHTTIWDGQDYLGEY